MAKIIDGELNKTMVKIMNYLREEPADGAKFVSYSLIAQKVGKSRHSVRYSINKLVSMDMLRIIDGELSL